MKDKVLLNSVVAGSKELLSLTRLSVPEKHKLQGMHRLGKMDFCPQTGGCAAITALPEFDKKGRLVKLDIKHWWHTPTGRSDTDNIISAGFSYDNDNAKLGKLSVYGRDVRTVPIARVILQAAGHIIEDIRHNDTLPNPARIFRDNNVTTLIGEGINIPGFSAEKGLSFYVPPAHDDNDVSPPSVPITMPLEIMEIFEKGGINTIDKTKGYQKNALSIAVSPDTLKTYKTSVSAVRVDNKAVQSAVSELQGNEKNINHLFNLTWNLSDKNEKTAAFKLAGLEIMGSNVSDVDTRTKMQMLGWINNTLNRVRNGKNPELYNGIVKHDLTDYLNHIQTDKTLAEGGETFLISLYGHNEKNVYKNIGDGPGECKAIIHAGKDENGTVKLTGIIQDVAYIIAAENSGFDGALPDLSLFMSFDHFTLSHMHIDHLDGLAMYIRLYHNLGLFKDKHIYAKAEDVRQLRIRLGQLYAKDPDLLPHIHTIKGDGNFEIENGLQKIRVEYYDALSHSAKGTMFRYISGSNGVWNASVRIHADARFDEDWISIDREKYEEWCSRGLRNVGIDRNDTYIEYDALSLKQEGFAPKEADCEENLFTVMKLFPDKGIMFGQLSKNASHFVSGLRLASRLGRNITAYGANIEETARAHNILKIERRYHPHFAEDLNIEDYLKEFFVYYLRERVLPQIIENKINPGKEDILKGFQTVADYDEYKEVRSIAVEVAEIDWNDDKTQGWQEEYQDEDEEVSQSYSSILRGRLATVSNENEFNIIKEELQLFTDVLESDYHTSPSYFYSRLSQSGKSIVSGPAAKRFIFNTFATNESALAKLFQGRGLMASDPKTKDSAIPVFPEDNVIFLVQTPNPSNDKEIADLIKQGINSGWMMVVATNNGFSVHGLHNDKRDEILPYLNNKHLNYTLSSDKRTLTVHDMPIHAPGHGFKQDNFEQMKMDCPDIVNATHNNDFENTEVLYSNAEKLNIRHPDDMFKNSEIIAIDKGTSPETATVKSRGFIPSSFMTVKVYRKQGQFYGGYIGAERIILPARANSVEAGLKAGSRDAGEIIKQNFAEIDIEAEQYKQEIRDRRKTQPSVINVTIPHLPAYRGPAVPCL